jgi:hypothetical protein
MREQSRRPPPWLAPAMSRQTRHRQEKTCDCLSNHKRTHTHTHTHTHTQHTHTHRGTPHQHGQVYQSAETNEDTTKNYARSKSRCSKMGTQQNGTDLGRPESDSSGFQTPRTEPVTHTCQSILGNKITAIAMNTYNSAGTDAGAVHVPQTNPMQP